MNSITNTEISDTTTTLERLTLVAAATSLIGAAYLVIMTILV